MHESMLWTNLSGCMVALLLGLCTGHITEGVAFCLKNHECMCSSPSEPTPSLGPSPSPSPNPNPNPNPNPIPTPTPTLTLTLTLTVTKVHHLHLADRMSSHMSGGSGSGAPQEAAPVSEA